MVMVLQSFVRYFRPAGCDVDLLIGTTRVDKNILDSINDVDHHSPQSSGAAIIALRGIQ